jgi:glycosyltransferase involved in cell wall biosynthesis
MTRIAIVSAASPARDAVGNDIHHMADLFRRQGHPPDVFTRVWGEDQPRNCRGRTVPSYLGRDRSAVLIYHHTSGYEAAIDLVHRLRCRRVIRYHNVTPAHFFEPYDPSITTDCRTGREQLDDLIASNCELYLSDSEYNQSELLAHGAPPERCAVVPPFHQADALGTVEPDPEVLEDLLDGHINLLFVGRRAPNKGHRLLIDAFAAYADRHNPQSRLFLVGAADSRLRRYDDELREQVRRLGLQGRVAFLGGIDAPRLRAYYASAAALVVTSEHEGFCVPAIEAMALGVPVVAWGTTAVANTIGDAGLVWPEADPNLLAASIDAVVRNLELRLLLADRGRRRYHRFFRPAHLEADFLRCCWRPASAVRSGATKERRCLGLTGLR